MKATVRKFFDQVILARPLVTLLVVALICCFFLVSTPDFKLDASSDSLLLEGDRDLCYYQEVRRVYPSDDYLVVTFSPQDDLFSRQSLATLEALVSDLKQLDRVASVFSMLDAPLFRSPKISLMQLATGYRTLRSEDVDLALAHTELTESPMFRDYLVSSDGSTTGVLINFVKDPAFEALAGRRDELKCKKGSGGLSEEEKLELAEISRQHRLEATLRAVVWREDVARVREVLKAYKGQAAAPATLYLGGIPMIVADMIQFVRRDLVVFGIGVLVFLILMLGIIFRRPRWVVLPLTTCATAVAVMIGFLGWMDWRATVISSNFTSLLFIITMSMAIHMVVRYRELSRLNPDADHRQLVLDATAQVVVPCLYCALTTMVGFGSLYFSGIRPVIDFGRMMGIGIAVAWLLCFTLLPAMLLLLPKQAVAHDKESSFSLTRVLAGLTRRRGTLIMVIALVFALLGGVGVARLSVENRFIGYFKQSTEIYQGMEVIDRQLGGTTPLELILAGEGKDYWYKPENLARVRQLHEFLDELPESGKVLSLDTMMRSVEQINDGKPVNGFILNMVRQFLPQKMKKDILYPYISENGDQLRIVVRIQEGYPELRRNELLGKVSSFLSGTMAMEAGTFQLTGMYVLYNNMLESLFQSQINTIAVVYLVTWLMFALLFRSFYLATIGLIPNMFPVILVLGILGWLGIPLDMMTITVAAITIGIAVDNTIHYIHRFKLEFARSGNYLQTMERCHESIGKAMYYTSITIIAGFSILALSNFIPTIYFGLFTGLAMTSALLAAMTLLPKLLILLKPLGPEFNPENQVEAGRL